MRLAEDRRGRVPFSLVAALLLVTSASFAAASAQWRPAPESTAADRAAAQAMAGARVALERAATVASVAAASSPTVDPAATPFGDVLADANTTPFRAGLRLRTYLAARDALERVRVREGGTTATVTLPPIDTPADARRSLGQIAFAPGPNASTSSVTVRGLRLVLRQEGRVVHREHVRVSLLVGTPIVRVHRRLARFERRLSRPFVAGPGLDRRLTAGLFEVATARGYAQYAGTPIANVLANRHVALATNAALGHEQRRVFGRIDPATLVGVRRAATRTSTTDLLTAAQGAGRAPSHVPSPGASSRLAVSPEHAADRALLAFLDESTVGSLRATLADAYSVDARLVVRVLPLGATERAAAAARDRRSVTVEPAVVAPPRAPPGFHRIAVDGRRVTVRTPAERGNGTVVEERRVRVAVGVFGRHAGGTAAPERPFAAVHTRGGTLDGPNFADVARRAVDRLVRSRGGVDAVARRAALGDVPSETITIHPDRPSALRERALAEVLRLRDRVADLRVRGPTRRLAVDTNPGALLVRRLDARRAALVDAPARYDGASDRALTAVRAAYLDAVRARLVARVGRVDALQSRLRERFEVPAVEHAAAETAAPDAVADVRASPAYLSLSAVPPGRVPGVDRRYYPLAARNVNVFTLPHGDAADAVLDGLFGRRSATVSLATAAQTLRAANATLRRADDPNPELERARDALRGQVAGALGGVAAGLRRGVDDSDAADPLSRSARYAAVSAGLAEWETVDGRALAAVNGSLAGAVATAVARRADLGGTDRAVLETRLRVALADARTETAVRVDERAVSDVPPALRAEATAAAGNLTRRAVDHVAERRLGKRLGALPSGLPVAPVPGYWYATVNLWHVSVEGSYARFVVRDGGVAPTLAPNGTLRYVREDAPVHLDVDGDGVRERIGRNRRLSFAVETTVLVAVPPGPRGVGDTDGDADERSAGWGNRRESRR